MDGFRKLPKMQCFKEGGSVKSQIAAFERKEEKSEGKKDMAQDKSMVKKGVRQHESALHKGEPKTELKLKTGGRAKKSTGTVKKFAKAPSAADKSKNTTAKFKDGGKVSNVYEAKKSSGDKDNIKKTKLIKPAKAAAPSAAKKAKNTPAKFCGGKGVRKMAGGREVEIEVKDPQALTDKIALEENTADANIIPNALKSVKRIGKQVLKTAKDAFSGQGAVSDAERSNIAKKKGGKVKKYAEGGSVLSDEEKAWLGGADATDPFIQARMRDALGPKKAVAAAPAAVAARPDPAMIEDESGRGNISPNAAAFNRNIPGAGPAAAAPSAPVARPVARPAMRRPNPAMIEDESKRGVVTPDQQLYNRGIAGSGNAYQAPNVEQDSGMEYPVKPGFFTATPGQQAASFRRGAQQRQNVGRKIGDWLGLNKNRD